MFFIGPVCWPNSLNSCLQLQNFGCLGLRTAFSNTSMRLKLALRLVSKSTNNVFHTASMLNKISEIHVYSFKVLDARASGLQFPAPSWAWSLPWRCYQKVPIMFFHRPSMLTKIPQIHDYSFKTLDARASGQHFPTPPWAWSWPWGWYQKEPIMFFHRANMLNKIPKIHVHSFKTQDARASELHFPTPPWAWSWPWG